MPNRNQLPAKGKKVLLMAGGTGGHVIPALSLAQCFQDKGFQVEWLGSTQGIENKLVPAAGIKLNRVEVVGVRGKGLIRKLLAPFLILRAVWQAKMVLRQYRPDFVLGLGGFASGPGGIAAWLSGIPVFVHEQNAVAGLTNRWLSRIARQTFAAFPNAFPESVALVTGNPVRQALFALPTKAETSQPLRLLVVGGSLGALALNQALPKALSLLPEQSRPEVWHQSGKDKLQATEALYQANNVKAQVVEFIDDMIGAFAWADLVLCRAGALTVSELAAAGRASILVPLPIAVDDHQTANARFLVNEDAAVLLPQKEMSVEHLAERLQLLFAEPEQLVLMGLNARKAAQPMATQTVVDHCCAAVFGEKF
ncbi:UDP-N-acetylglucosamine-N-acetylmuramylpentapeptide N-acetylglucosamine transferase [Oceanospirillum multiglobuliferum]|uniref:UDP-N-acetylglucosamine--N-acetylmuramyl-(pentapeptide) pyrophosphoryl-undecaprenol N-acetylglucosamine transferase n=1 Tax=Oceanospirillum multiglobuliferum TaxID=64969 RepID=A0A1T4KQX0_9GAMM|nr:undecaprenyldiphospho-muramoylpentapeptide beta-N-acetylglucosaminyltransferase [Oceanospirillum multiglobuliferum]OPX56115.1 undecaprenyldiphospho-muramoylpentapeptide beta-N-acetylglucosaminyltransferase [Oceanospirillum multiglobuliferum]SJZ44839.1 UDP-N-acetylglucosamine-N-acetylmuramylpentapeptide N-acetylglucosamine transferase [Oceanospirillum multiglobuliferum]